MKKLLLLILTLISFNALATEEEIFKYPGAVVSGRLGTFSPRNADGVDIYQIKCNAPINEKGRVIAKVKTNIFGDKKPYSKISVQLFQEERASLLKTANHFIPNSPGFMESKWTILNRIDCNKNFLLAVSKNTFDEKNPKWVSSYTAKFACQSNKGFIYPVSYKLVKNDLFSAVKSEARPSILKRK